MEVSTKELNGANSKVTAGLKLLEEGKITAKAFAEIYNAAIEGQEKLNNAVKEGQVQVTTFKDLLSTGLGKLFGFAEGSDKAKILGQTITAAFTAASQAMDTYFSNEKSRIEASVALNKKRLDEELSYAKEHAQSQAERDSLDQEYQAKKERLDKDAFEKNKKLQKAQAAINLAIQLSNLAVIAFSPGPLNIVTLGAAGAISYGIQAALAFAIYASNIARINSTAFEFGGNPDMTTTKGGRVKGRSHAAGGNPFIFKGRVYEDEIDELNIIRTKNAPANKNYNISGTQTQIASMLNKIGGGHNFAPGAILRTFEKGGAIGDIFPAPVFTPATISTSSTNNQDLSDMLIAIKEQTTEMRSQTAAINGRIDRLSVVLDPNAVTKAQDKRDKQIKFGTI